MDAFYRTGLWRLQHLSGRGKPWSPRPGLAGSHCEATDLETVIQDLLTGQYRDPIRVIAFDTAEGWSQDVSEDIAQELRRRCDLQLRDVPSSIQDFVERHEGSAPAYTAAGLRACFDLVA